MSTMKVVGKRSASPMSLTTRRAFTTERKTVPVAGSLHCQGLGTARHFAATCAKATSWSRFEIGLVVALYATYWHTVTPIDTMAREIPNASHALPCGRLALDPERRQRSFVAMPKVLLSFDFSMQEMFDIDFGGTRGVKSPGDLIAPLSIFGPILAHSAKPRPRI